MPARFDELAEHIRNSVVKNMLNVAMTTIGKARHGWIQITVGGYGIRIVRPPRREDPIKEQSWTRFQRPIREASSEAVHIDLFMEQ